jgi:hypothetical protein
MTITQKNDPPSLLITILIYNSPQTPPNRIPTMLSTLLVLFGSLMLLLGALWWVLRH